MSQPRITFGIIVLNGEPFTRYCLRALYPFAHEIIVVEGAVPASAGVATADGHSRDDTLQVLRDLQAHEDPDRKLVIVTAEDAGYPNGFWPGEKHEQSQAYAIRVTGDYLWQIDIDEFYRPTDMEFIIDLLRNDQEIAGISFRQITFWGGFEYWTDSWYLWQVLPQIHRVFKWRQGYRYASHRPPTVLDEHGVDLRTRKWISGNNMEQSDIRMYHYSLVFPSQVLAKCDYYGNADWAKRHQATTWAQEAFIRLRRPYRVHNVYDYPSWLERFTGTHPPEIEKLRQDLASGKLRIEVRDTADIERLLASPAYWVGRWCLKKLGPFGSARRHYLLWRGRLSNLMRYPRRTIRRIAQRLAGRPLT